MTALLMWALLAASGPVCAEGGQSTMDPRLEQGTKISTKRRVREPGGKVAPMPEKSHPFRYVCRETSGLIYCGIEVP